MTDTKVEQPLLLQLHLAPSAMTAAAGEQFALELLAEIIGHGSTSVLYRKLVREKEIATSIGASYDGCALDTTYLYIHATPREGVPLQDVEAAVASALTEFIEGGIDGTELARAKTRLVAEAIYDQDSQLNLAYRLASRLTVGQPMDSVLDWPERIKAVTAGQVLAAARSVLDFRRGVTGYLLPEPPGRAAPGARS